MTDLGQPDLSYSRYRSALTFWVKVQISSATPHLLLIQ